MSGCILGFNPDRGVVVHVERKGISNFDDDADFRASFVLNQDIVESALEADTASVDSATTHPTIPVESRKMLLYAGLAALATLIIAVAWLLPL